MSFTQSPHILILNWCHHYKQEDFHIKTSQFCSIDIPDAKLGSQLEPLHVHEWATVAIQQKESQPQSLTL